MITTLSERFAAKVDRTEPDGCWPWLGNRSSRQAGRDYGRFYVDGRLRPAHVVAWEMAHGEPFPEGMDGCHSCDNPPCVNPAHIFPGTARDNARDMTAKGRGRNQMDTKTHCVHGHPLSGDNLRIFRGTRRCVACHRWHVNAYSRRTWYCDCGWSAKGSKWQHRQKCSGRWLYASAPVYDPVPSLTSHD